MLNTQIQSNTANQIQNDDMNICGLIKIMVIDDQRAMRKIIRQLLHVSNFDCVTEASNGEEALEKLNTSNKELPDLIICDLHMDKMDGMNFIAHMRRSKNSSLSEIPIFILTGDSDPLLHEVTKQVGATKVMTKPISAQKLLKEVQGAIGFSINT